MFKKRASGEKERQSDERAQDTPDLFGVSGLIVGAQVVWYIRTYALNWPAKILSPFLCTAPLQYVPKIIFTPATIDCLATNKTNNALHKEMVILNYIDVEPIIQSLSI